MRAATDIVIYEILYDSRELYTKLKQKWNHPNLRAVVEVSAMSYPSAYITNSMLFFVVTLLNVATIVIVEAIVIDL